MSQNFNFLRVLLNLHFTYRHLRKYTKEIIQVWYNKRIKPTRYWTQSLHSSAADTYTYNLEKDIWSFRGPMKEKKKRANEKFRSFQNLSCRLYYFLICVETEVLRSTEENIQKLFVKQFFNFEFKLQISLRSFVLRSTQGLQRKR